jgi:hypothetical protein
MNPFRKPFVILVGAILVAALSAAPAAAGLVASDFELGPTKPGKWGAPVLGTGATVTWSLTPSGTSCAADFVGCTLSALSSFMPAGFKAEIEAAFDAWAAVADLTFVEVPDDGAPFNAPTASGDIRLAGHVFDGPFGTLAHGFFPPVNGLTAAGDIHFDTAELWKIGFGGPGFDIFQVAAHEIGHAIGLGHEEVELALMNPYYTEAFRGLLQDDIDGAVFIYGEREGEVPEPGTLLLIGSGLIAFSLRRRRS